MELTQRERRDVIVSAPEALSWRLGTFRPSDRAEFQRVLLTEGGRDVAFKALEIYVSKWEQATWLEEYSLERLGKWVAAQTPAPFVAEVKRLAGKRRTKARLALRRGLSGPSVG